MLFPGRATMYEIEDIEIRLFGAGDAPRIKARVVGSSQSFAFDDLPEGLFRIEIDDPRFERQAEDLVEPGSSIRARLEGISGIRLEVVDAATGEALGR